MPQVSVVLPVYNGARYLREALDSVFAQTFQDFEVICVDDGSTDQSAAILRTYGDRVRVFEQENSGQGSARNAGAKPASGEYLAFLDQDDRWYPSKLERQVIALEKESDAVLVYCNSDRMDHEGKLLQVGATLVERATARSSLLGRLIGEELILPSAMLVRREAFLHAGMFDPSLRGYEDFDLCARLKRWGRFIFLEKSDMCYRVHNLGFNVAGGSAVVRSRERFLLKMRDLYSGDRVKQQLIRTMLAECYSDWGLREAKTGRGSEGRRLLLRALAEDPLKFRTYSRLIRSFLPTGMVKG